MSRQTDLESYIRESYSFIKEYEQTIRLSGDPEEKARAHRGCEKHWLLIEQEYLPEYQKLVGGELPHEIAQIAARFTSKTEPVSAQNDLFLTPSRKPFEPEMILIPAGEFLMGEGEALRYEYLPAYYIAKTPTTNIQYLAFVRAGGKCPERWQGGKIPAGQEHHPVIYVSWNDAVAYCDWLSQATAKIYRLPTEQEWEKAARGTDGRKYPWGNKWLGDWQNTEEPDTWNTMPVGQYSPRGDSPYGCTDMAGPVWEWTNSVHKGHEHSRVVRGGVWNHRRVGARCAAWLYFHANLSDYNFGFRCVVPVPGS